MDKYSSILLILTLFFAVNALIRYQEKTWVSPASLFSLCCTLLITLSVILAPEYYFSFPALLYILSIIMVCFTGSWIYNYISPYFSRSKDNSNLDLPAQLASSQRGTAISVEQERFLFTYIILSILASSAATIILLHGFGYSIRSLFSVESYLAIASALSESRYAEVSEPPGTTLLLGIGFSGNLVAGFLFIFSKSSRHKIVSILSVVPILFYTIIYTARAPFLFSVTFFISSLLAAAVFVSKGRVSILTKKNILTGTIFGFFLLTLFMVTQIARIDSKEMSYEELLRIFNHIKGSFVGNLSPFCIWFDTVVFNNFPAWGGFSFAGFFDFIGIIKREIGVFSESYDISRSFNYSNIFTLFRAVIEDYTLTGSYVFFLLSGFVSAFIYQEVKAQRIIFIGLLSAVFSFYLWSCIVSIFAYNTVIFAFVIYVAILVIMEFQYGK